MIKNVCPAENHRHIIEVCGKFVINYRNVKKLCHLYRERRTNMSYEERSGYPPYILDLIITCFSNERHFWPPRVCGGGQDTKDFVQYCLNVLPATFCNEGIRKLVRRYIKCLNPLTPNDPYRGRTAPLTSKCCILYIYSTSIGTEYFKHGIYCPFFFPLQNAVCFIILTFLVPVLFTFYIQVC